MTLQQQVEVTLKPCPFCGRPAFINTRGGVSCERPFCGGMEPNPTVAESVDAWNTRQQSLTDRNSVLEEAAKVATSFLVGDPANGVPLRSPMAHEIADRIRALKTDTALAEGSKP